MIFADASSLCCRTLLDYQYLMVILLLVQRQMRYIFHVTLYQFSYKWLCKTTEYNSSMWIRCSYTTRLSPCQYCSSSFRIQIHFQGMKWMMLHNLCPQFVGAVNPQPCLLQIPLGMSKFWRWFKLTFLHSNLHIMIEFSV